MTYTVYLLKKPFRNLSQGKERAEHRTWKWTQKKDVIYWINAS